MRLLYSRKARRRCCNKSKVLRRRYYELELIHARWAMLSALGILIPGERSWLAGSQPSACVKKWYSFFAELKTGQLPLGSVTDICSDTSECPRKVLTGSSPGHAKEHMRLLSVSVSSGFCDGEGLCGLTLLKVLVSSKKWFNHDWIRFDPPERSQSSQHTTDKSPSMLSPSNLRL